MVTSDWLIGAFENHPAFTFEVNSVSKTIPASSRYLYDTNAAISLMTQVEAKCQEEDAGCTLTLTQSGKTKFTAGTSISVTWDPSDSTLRNALGHSADFAGVTTTHVGANHAKYLWRSGSTVSPGMAPLDETGSYTSDRVYAEAAGIVTSVEHNNWRENELLWRHILAAKYWTSARLNGEYYTFWQDVIMRSYRFKLYRKVMEAEVTTDANLAVTILGPYVLKPPMTTRFPFERAKGLEHVDKTFEVDLKVRTVVELS